MNRNKNINIAGSYEDGYQTGCRDAGRDYRGLNGHRYDESMHKGDQNFKNGYVVGYRACWATAAGGTPANGGINWLAICRIPVVDGLLGEPCETLTTADGYTLTAEGKRVVGCIVGIIGGSRYY